MILLLITAGEDRPLVHQLKSRITELKILCVTWRAKTRAIPCAYDVGDSWGSSDDTLADVATSEVTGNWEYEDPGVPAPRLPNMTDSNVSDVIDEDSDHSLDVDDEGDSDRSEDLFVVPSVGLLSVHSPKHVRVV
jgi:hypothetical protein